jgi:hypothetical protein
MIVADIEDHTHLAVIVRNVVELVASVTLASRTQSGKNIQTTTADLKNTLHRQPRPDSDRLAIPDLY